MTRKIYNLILILILSLLFATPAFAQGPGGPGRVIFGDNFTLEAEETINGDLVVFGGNVTTEKSSKIDGNLVVFGGNAEISGDVYGDMVVFGGNVDLNGTVDGDLGAIGGNVKLGESAVVKGDIGHVGGHISRADGSEVQGSTQGLNDFKFDPPGSHDDDDGGFAHSASSSYSPVGAFFAWIGRVVADIFWTISLLIILGLITWLVVTFMPDQMLIVRNTVLDSLPLSFGVGAISWIVTGVSFILILTICLAFIPIIASIVLGIASLFGWIVIGQIVGERLLVSNNRIQPTLIATSVIGVWVLTILVTMPVVGQLPILGWLLAFIGFIIKVVVTFVGTGAVLLTRFGSRPYVAGSPSTYAYPSGSPSPSGGSRVRWTEPVSDVSEQDMPGSEEELNAKIKAALAEADQESEAKAEDEEKKPKKSTKRRKKPEDEPDAGPDPEE